MEPCKSECGQWILQSTFAQQWFGLRPQLIATILLPASRPSGATNQPPGWFAGAMAIRLYARKGLTGESFVSVICTAMIRIKRRMVWAPPIPSAQPGVPGRPARILKLRTCILLRLTPISRPNSIGFFRSDGRKTHGRVKDWLAVATVSHSLRRQPAAGVSTCVTYSHLIFAPELAILLARTLHKLLE